MEQWFAVIVITLLLSAFFSGIEIAFISANKLRIALDKKQNAFLGKILSNFYAQPSRFISTMLIGNNIALVVFSIAMANVVEPPLMQLLKNYGFFYSEFSLLMIQTLLSTIIIIFLGEYIPKAIFSSYPNALLKTFAVPSLLIYYILFIPVYLISEFTELLLKKIFKLSFDNNPVAFGRVDLDNYIKEISKQVENQSDKEIEHEIQIFQNALDFTKTKARDCMLPRTEIVAVEVNSSMNELKKIFIETGLSKILVYDDSIDNIIGYVHSFDLFNPNKETIKSVLRPILVVPETAKAKDILTQLLQENKSIAVVIDEFGGTSGMLTTEDIIEEIFGEIEDEHDVEDLIEKKLNDYQYIFSARLEIDYINATYKLSIPESESYSTLAGFILDQHESIPNKGEKIEIPPFSFEILQVKKNKIELLKLTITNNNT